MKRILLLGSILLLSAVGAFAQYDKQPDPSSPGTTMTTVEGCLASADGNYSLTDKFGTTYQLAGDTAKLQAHVGHTIQITGSTSPNTQTTGDHAGSMSGAADARQMFTVTSFKHVSPHCNAMK
jgi:hypothetical protein